MNREPRDTDRRWVGKSIMFFFFATTDKVPDGKEIQLRSSEEG